MPAVIAQPDRVSAPVESPPSATGGPRSNSGRTFDIAPERRDAMLLSAALWTGACGLLGVGAVLAGNIENLGEYLTLPAGLLTSLLGAYALYRLLAALAGRPRLLAYAILLVAPVILALAQSGADLLWFRLLHWLLPETRLPGADPLGLVIVVFTYTCLYAANLALLWATSAHRALRLKNARLARAEAEREQSELQVLRLKLDPHFMFNALNGAANLVAAGRREEAGEMLSGLSTFLRTSLDIGVDDIPFGEELSIVSEYLGVEAIRFPERLKVRIDHDPATEDAMVPGFLLQPIVENAVKHGVAASCEPVAVTVTARIEDGSLAIRVENDLPASPSSAEGAGVGLEATRARLRLRYGDEGRLEAGPVDGRFRVDIRIPLHSPVAGPVREHPVLAA